MAAAVVLQSTAALASALASIGSPMPVGCVPDCVATYDATNSLPALRLCVKSCAQTALSVTSQDTQDGVPLAGGRRAAPLADAAVANAQDEVSQWAPWLNVPEGTLSGSVRNPTNNDIRVAGGSVAVAKHRVQARAALRAGRGSYVECSTQCFSHWAGIDDQQLQLCRAKCCRLYPGFC